MQITLHLGVQCTDEDRLLKGLLKNVGDLRKDGICIPGPGRYRTLLSDTLNTLGEATPAPEAREVLLDAILDEDPKTVRRLVLSHENLLSVPKLALSGGRLYRKLEQRLPAMARLFPCDGIEIFVGCATSRPTCLRSTTARRMAASTNSCRVQIPCTCAGPR